MARPKEFDPDKAIDKAMDLFWLQGYAATSVQELCDCMGINKGSFYDTFGSKRSLFLKTLDRYQELNAISPDLIRQAGSAKKAVEAIFMKLVEDSVFDKESRGCFMVNTITELAARDLHIADIATTARQSYNELFYNLLLAGKENGEIRGDKDLRAMSHFLTNAIFGLRVIAKTTRDSAILRGIVESNVSILD